MKAASVGDTYGGEIVARSFFESVFLFADKDNKGKLVVNDLKILFQVRSINSSGCHTERSRDDRKQTIGLPAATLSPPWLAAWWCRYVLEDGALCVLLTLLPPFKFGIYTLEKN